MSGISSYNPLLAYSCLWQTLDSGTWYSVWSTGLSYEFARSLALLLHFMAAYEGNNLMTKIAVQKKKDPAANYVVRWPHREKWERQRVLFQKNRIMRAEWWRSFARVISVIKLIMFFVIIQTKLISCPVLWHNYVHYSKQLGNITRHWRLYLVLLLNTFSYYFSLNIQLYLIELQIGM
jgi:hypothetical protein